jgi:hypothetical protein
MPFPDDLQTTPPDWVASDDPKDWAIAGGDSYASTPVATSPMTFTLFGDVLVISETGEITYKGELCGTNEDVFSALVDMGTCPKCKEKR